MIQGIYALTAVGVALLLLWSHAEWKVKRAEHRAEVAERRADNLRERLGVVDRQLEWLRSRSNHPAFRRIK